MARLPYAAEVLIAEAKEIRPDLEVEPADTPDGFDVHRTVKFDKTTSALLAAPLQFLEDNRVHSVNLTDAGYLHVTFRDQSAFADVRDPFMLKIALDILAEKSEPDSDRRR